MSLPLVDILHHYTVFEPPNELKQPSKPIPAIVDHETNWYIRPFK